MKKIAMLHTSSATLAMMQQLIGDIMPEADVMHLVEESMIKQVMKAGGVTPKPLKKLARKTFWARLPLVERDDASVRPGMRP